MVDGLGIGSRISVPGGEGVVTGLADDGRLLIVALDDGDVIECDVELALARPPRRSETGSPPAVEDGVAERYQATNDPQSRHAGGESDARRAEDGASSPDEPRRDFTRRQANLLQAGRACMGELVETLEALAGEDQVGVVLMLCVGDANLRTKGAVVLSNLPSDEARLTMANGLEAARLQEEQASPPADDPPAA